MVKQKPSQTEVRTLAMSKGFYDMRSWLMRHLHTTGAPPELLDFAERLWAATRLALIHAEVSEALETVARAEPEKLPAELADIQLRLMDFAEDSCIELDAAVATKHSYNQGRPIRHGGKKL